MEPTFSELQSWGLALLLTMPRIAIAVLILPFLTRRLLGGFSRAALAAAWALPAVPLTRTALEFADFTTVHLLIFVPKELLIGTVLGFLAGIPFWVAASLGRVMDFQRGAMAVLMFTPTFRDQSSPIGTLFVQALAALFMAGTGVILFLQAIYRSYVIWPVWSWVPEWQPGAYHLLAVELQSVLYWVVMLGAPSLIVVFLVDIVMGFLNRFVPELNVFFLAFPFKGVAIMLTLVVFGASQLEAMETDLIIGGDWLATLKEVLQ